MKETRTSWIQTISYKQATGKLKAIYERVKGPHNDIDNILLAHSLRPHTLEGHMAIYKSVLHHNGNRLPTSLLETLGVYVSLLNGCDYCVQHHFAGLKRLLANDARAPFSPRLKADNSKKLLTNETWPSSTTQKS